MKQYKKAHPLHNFALVSDLPKSDKPTIFRYIWNSDFYSGLCRGLEWSFLF
jgi:hypothetical protein